MPDHDPGRFAGEDRERGIAHVRGRIIMRSTVRFATLSVGLITFTLLAAGCGRGRERRLRHAAGEGGLGVKEAGKERTVESNGA